MGKVKHITIVAILVALNLVLSYVAKIPTGTGFVSLVETGIILGAWLLGATSGAAVGGLTGFLLDLLAGYPQWMIFSLVIHGAEGWVFGAIKNRITAGIVGLIVMVGGYWIAGTILLMIMGAHHLSLSAAAIASLADIPANIMQVIVGFILGFILIKPLQQLTTD